MLLIKRLKLKDFYSHEDTTVEFAENVKLLLDGESGAGKSSILESIIFAIYGEARTDNKSLVRGGAKKASVTLEMIETTPIEGGSSLITIERAVTSTGKHTLELLLDGVASPLSGIKEIQGFIEKEIIGASYLLFVNSVAYMQGNSDSFVLQNAAKRKELLLEIVKAENYDEYYEAAKNKLTTLAAQRVALQNKDTELRAAITSAEVTIAEEKQIKESLVLVESEISTLDKVKEELLKAVAKFEEIEKNIILGESRMAGAEMDVIRATEALESLRKQLNDTEALTFDQGAFDACGANIEVKTVLLDNLDVMLRSQTAKEKAKSAYIQTRPYVQDLSSSIAQLEEANKRLSAREWCPSGTSCPHQLPTIEEIDLNKKKIVELNQKMVIDAILLEEWNKGLKEFEQTLDTEKLLNEIKEARAALSTLSDELSKMETIRTKMGALEVLRKNIPFLEQDLNAKITARDIVKKELDVLKSMFDALGQSSIRTDISNTNSALIEKRAKEVALSSQLMIIENAKLTLKEKNTELDIISKEDLPSLDRNISDVSLAKEAFGSKGIKSVVIDYLLPKLEDKINSVLAQMSDFTVRLDTQQLKSDGEGNKEGLFITLVNELGQELPYENYSGGEKLKINVAIAEALASLQKVGFRLMDETFVGLDENSTESFALVLERLQNSFSQVVMISHIREVKEMFEDKITVIKKNGKSQLV